MRIESSVTSISWIPSEAIEGVFKLPFETGVGHYDQPPPDHIDDLEALRIGDRFRFANELRAFVEVEDGRIVGHGYLGGGHIGNTRFRLARQKAIVFRGASYPDIQQPEAVGPDRVRFVQTTGGRSGIPAPRTVRRKPFVQLRAPTVWTTLALTIHVDGTHTYEVAGASRFPRHWVYDGEGKLVAKVGTADFKDWYRSAFGAHSPWGDEDAPAITTAAETALERELSAILMRHGAEPEIRTLDAGELLTKQGDAGTEVFLLLDGVLEVEVDGELLTELGPGAVLGERALLEGGIRTATLRAVSRCRVAVAAPSILEDPEGLDADRLTRVSQEHRREERRGAR